MIKIFVVIIKCGFKGVKYFHNEENASQFAKSVNEKVEAICCTPIEYVNLPFEDVTLLQETINVPITVLAF
jgi:hypothetical protein